MDILQEHTSSTKGIAMVKDQLYQDFKQNLRELVDEATRLSSISEDSPTLARCLDSLEGILTYGFKGKRKWLQITMAGLWDFIEETIKRDSTAPDVANLVDTVKALSEKTPEIRVKVYLKMALMQQTLGQHLLDLSSNESELSTWYEPWSIMMNADDRAPVIGMVNGLAKLEFNLYVKEEKPPASSITMPNVPVPTLKDLETFKTSIISHTESIQDGFLSTVSKVQSAFSRKTSATETEMVTSFAPDKDSTQMKLELDNWIKKAESLVVDLNNERKQRLKLEVELISVKMARDKEVMRLKHDVQRLEQILEDHGISVCE